MRWLGTASVEQLERLLKDAHVALEGGRTPADVALARADQLNAQRKFDLAAEGYADALAREDAQWPPRARAACPPRR